MVKTLQVALPGRAYPIHIGKSLLDQAAHWLAPLRQPRVIVVTNQTVGPMYLPRLQHSFTSAGVRVESIEIPDGEEYKTAETLNHIHTQLLTFRAERKTTLVALGGGVVGDLAGFAAATYQRGMPFVQVPTTLLAQVDSSVGGKTAINHPLGKNMIGAFYQPQCVLIDTETLNTLPDREFKAGLAEVIKYGLIRDLPFFEWLEANLDAVLDRNPEALTYAIEASCRNKAEVVVADETETGERALLNLGHTFGHAIEAGLGYGVWLHGEAVAAGTMQAAQLSARLGWLSSTDVDRAERLLVRAGLPVQAPALGVDRYLDLMRVDKKVEDGRLRLILLRRIGEAVVKDDVPEIDVMAVLG